MNDFEPPLPQREALWLSGYSAGLITRRTVVQVHPVHNLSFFGHLSLLGGPCCIGGPWSESCPSVEGRLTHLQGTSLAEPVLVSPEASERRAFMNDLQLWLDWDLIARLFASS